MRPARIFAPVFLGLALAACSTEGRPGSAADGPYMDHEEDLDYEPVEGKADGVSAVFNKDLVIDDSFFTAASALSVADIQGFLENTPYGRRSFLADEQVGGRPFSEVLVEVAQGHGLNPIMLLSRLQVEKSLVGKSSSPGGNAVDFAMGCGCPDNKPCNEAYRGIDKQLDCAATTLKKHYDGSIAGTGQWRKGHSRSTLDPTAVTPQSHATASLYAYTPWVLVGQGGNWLVWNITKRDAAAFDTSFDGGPRPGFVGSECSESTEGLSEDEQARLATCEFSSGGESGFCFPFTSSAGEDLGLCSLMCEGLCPDQGSATTFCVELEAGAGFCVLKASSSNNDCADVPGTVATQADRFVGSSGVQSSSATVCWPDSRDDSGSDEPGSDDGGTDEPPPDGSGASCVGRCGTDEPVANGDGACYCDAGCANFGDCCGDYSQACG